MSASSPSGASRPGARPHTVDREPPSPDPPSGRLSDRIPPSVALFIQRLRRWADRVGPATLAALLLAALAVSVSSVSLLAHERTRPVPVEDQLPRAVALPGDPSAIPASATPLSNADPRDRSGASASSAAAAAPGSSVPAIVVHVAGAVARPDLYRLSSGARVDDAVRAAGGLTASADSDALNLAAPVGDGERLFVPRKGQVVPPIIAGASPGGSTGGGGPNGVGVGVGLGVGGGGGGGGGRAGGGGGRSGGVDGAGSGMVNLNTATAEQLDQLPGVGPAIAAAIIDWRQRHSGFRAVAQLLEVPGIGDAKFATLRPVVRV